MNSLLKRRPGLNTDALCVLDMPLTGGFQSGVLVQDRSQANNTGTADNGPIPCFPGWDFTADDITDDNSQSIGAGDVLGTVYPMTFCAWLNADAFDTQRDVVNGGKSSDPTKTGIDIDFSDPDTRIIMLMGPPVKHASAKAIGFTAGIWHCAVGVAIDTTNWSIYINGVLEQAIIDNAEPKDGITGWDRWKIGRPSSDGGSSEGFNGKIGSVMVFQKAFSAQEAMNYFQLTRHIYGV